MGTQLPQEMVYTITSGFYPELFSKDAGWKAGKGKGRKGMQWMHKRGWGKGTFKTIQGKPTLTEGWVGKFFGKLGQGQPWNKAYESLEGPQKKAIKSKGQELGMSQEEMETRLTKAKFMGHGEMYKLWGSRVWYQHGTRDTDKSLIETDLTNWMKTKKDLPVYLQNLYKDKETALIKMAKDLARDAFGEALDESNLRKDLKSVGAEADVPEEEREETPYTEKVDSIPSSFESITQARSADIKYRMEDGTALYMDSTEMPIHQANQHGIVQESIGGMKEAIEAAKEGGEEELEALRQAVVKMFIANVDVYNKQITKLITRVGAEGADKKSGIKSMEKILKNITKANKSKDVPPKDPRATVAQVGAILGIDTAEKNSQATALKYVIHTVINLAGDANQNFRQGHLVGTIQGQNTYASVPMKLKNTQVGGLGIPQFMKSVIAKDPPQGVLMLQGENHLLAIMEKDRNLADGVARETSARQKQAFMQGKICGVGAKGQQKTKANAQTNIRTRVRQSTTVTFAPKSFEKLISKIPAIVGTNTKPDSVMQAGKNFMSNKRKHKLDSFGSTKFWAMPYIGLMEYPTKSE